MTYTLHPDIDPQLDLIVPMTKDNVDRSMIQQLTQVSNPVFKGAFSDIGIMYGPQERRIYLLGLGADKDANKLGEAFRKLTHDTRKHWSEKIQVDCRTLNEAQVSQLVTGMEMADYTIGSYKSEEESSGEVEVLLCSGDDITHQVVEGQYTGETINRVKALVDAPANKKTPAFLAKWALKSSLDNGYESKIWDEEDLKQNNFRAILAVGQGSVHPPRLIEMRYMPRPDDPIDIGLVGKGITFDTGGLSIKGSKNLHYMKSDMGGAAVVLGAVELAARLKLNVNIVGLVGSAENAVDANSYRPGDVINSYSGKTIEIIDTDAEGRLVLADAINYMVKTHQPERMIDLATLTGSVVRTLGYSAAGLFTKNKAMGDALEAIGTAINEKVWPLPLFEEFEKDLRSDIADIRNFSGLPIAGAINAAKFLEAFTEDHPNWVHLDIAGVAFGDSSYTEMKSATGYGVRLIIEYIKSLEAK